MPAATTAASATAGSVKPSTTANSAGSTASSDTPNLQPSGTITAADLVRHRPPGRQQTDGEKQGKIENGK